MPGHPAYHSKDLCLHVANKHWHTCIQLTDRFWTPGGRGCSSYLKGVQPHRVQRGCFCSIFKGIELNKVWQEVCLFRTGISLGEIIYKPRPQNRILISLRISFQNFWWAPLSFLHVNGSPPPRQFNLAERMLWYVVKLHIKTTFQCQLSCSWFKVKFDTDPGQHLNAMHWHKW